MARARLSSILSAITAIGALCISLPAVAAGPEKWIEVRSPHFIVVSDAGEKAARRVAEEFEQFRAVFQAAMPRARIDPGRPVVVLATKDEKGLRALLPGFWEHEGQTRPSGIFAPAEERYYAAVQISVPSSNPYHNLYHEYVHLLNRLNFERLQVWLNEGLAEVYANTLIGAQTVELGRPDDEHLRRLRGGDLLPLETLFTVDHSSPYYNESAKASVFYAQSWALAHLLLFGDEARRAQLDQFMRLVARGTEPVAAAQEAFGNLRELEKRLKSYSQQTAFRLVKLDAPEIADPKAYALRELPAAEALAIRGDFLLQTHRPAEARAALQEALRLNPRFALAQETLGQLALREDDREEAFRWLSRAVEGGSQSPLTHYYYAMLLADRSSDPEQMEIVEEHLERALALNPDLAAAHAALSGFYASRPRMLEEALEHAQKAVELDPEVRDYPLNVARILLRMQRVEEALATGERARAAAVTADERDAAEAFLATARKFQRELLAWQKAEEEARVAAEERRKRRQEEAAARVAEETKPPEPPPQPQWGAGKTRRVTGSAVEGWISAVSCTEKAMNLQLDLGPYFLRLHSSDYFNMGLLTAGWTPPDDFDPCRHLKGRRAVVIYRAVEGKAYAGEILAVQIQK